MLVAFDFQIGNNHVYKSAVADSWYRSRKVSAPKTEFTLFEL